MASMRIRNGTESNNNNCRGMPGSKWLKTAKKMKHSSYKVGVNVAVFLMPYMTRTRRFSVVGN